MHRPTLSSEAGRRFRVGVLSLATALNSCRESRPNDPVRVAAASDLTFAFAELGRLFEARTGRAVVFSFGSSGLLAKQIARGAPFDLFAAANVGFVDEVVRSGACDGTTRVAYAQGMLALWSRERALLPETLEELGARRYRRIAIANPVHAPYGRAAEQAMTRLRAWPSIEAKLVYGENVRQALQFAESGNADVALVALALALETRGGHHRAIDPAQHAPIQQVLVVCGGGTQSDRARTFAGLVSSAEGRAIMQRHGFVVPAD